MRWVRDGLQARPSGYRARTASAVTGLTRSQSGSRPARTSQNRVTTRGARRGCSPDPGRAQRHRKPADHSCPTRLKLQSGAVGRASGEEYMARPQGRFAGFRAPHSTDSGAEFCDPLKAPTSCVPTESSSSPRSTGSPTCRSSRSASTSASGVGGPVREWRQVRSPVPLR